MDYYCSWLLRLKVQKSHEPEWDTESRQESHSLSLFDAVSMGKADRFRSYTGQTPSLDLHFDLKVISDLERHIHSEILLLIDQFLSK